MIKLDDILFPDHCSSCHSEWDSGYGYGEEPCCTKAASNIRDSVKKFVVALIKSDSDAFNGSDHQEDITYYANELIAKIEAL